MSNELPLTFGAIRASILMCFHFKDNAKMSAQEIKAVMDANAEKLPVQLSPSQISQNISALLAEKKYLIRSASNAKKKRYLLSAYGVEVAAALGEKTGEIEILPARGKTKKREEQEEIDFGTDFNVSNTAASLADGLTALIQENQGYRDLIVSFKNDLNVVVRKLDKALGIESEENHGSSKDS